MVRRRTAVRPQTHRHLKKRNRSSQVSTTSSAHYQRGTTLRNNVVAFNDDRRKTMSANPYMWEISEQCGDSMLELQKLRPVLAGRLAEHALQTAREQLGHDSSATQLPAALLGESLYEQGRLAEADNLLRFRIAAIRSGGSLECAARAYAVLARVAMHTGQREFALSLLRDARVLGERQRWPRLIAISMAEYCQLLLEDADIGAAEDSFADLVALLERSNAASGDRQHTLHMQRAVLEFRLAMARGCDVAAERLTHSYEGGLSGNFTAHWSLQWQLQLAASQARSGRAASGRNVLIEALGKGAEHGLCMSILDAGQPVRELIAGLCREPMTADAPLMDLLPYTRHLLRQFAQTAAPNGSRRVTNEVNQGLTKRESGVLQLIADGLSNKRIAQRLDIAPETVKSHAKNIFCKLAAQTRAQAVARGEALGII
jgi:ATP/maltotriose-dependent transcriptional regulator MalT